MSFILHAQTSQIQWQKTYGAVITNDPYLKLAPTADSCYIILGSVNDPGFGDGPDKTHGAADIWVLKIRQDSSVVWKKALGGSNNDYQGSVLATTDSGCLVTGYTKSNDGDVTSNHGGSDIWVVKLRKNGSIEWQKTYGGTNYEYPWGAILTSDGGYAIVGETYSEDGDVKVKYPDTSYGNAFVLKIKKNGALQWMHSFGGTIFEMAFSIVDTPDHGFITVGYTDSHDGDVRSSFTTQGEYVWLFKVNGSGNLIWQKNYGGYGDNIGFDIISTPDTGYIVSAHTSANDGDVHGNHGGYDIWIFKIKKDTIIQWSKCFGGSYDETNPVCLLPTRGGYSFLAQASSHDDEVTNYHHSQDMWVVKVIKDTIIEWERAYGGSSGKDYAGGMVSSPDGGFVFSGITSSTDGDVTSPDNYHLSWVVRLHAAYQIKILQNSGCLPYSAKLTTGNPIPASDSVSLFWDFGDGKGYLSCGDTVYTPAFMKAGNYKIKLRFINNRYGYTGTILSEDSITISVTGRTLSTPSVLLKGKDTLVASYKGDSCQWYLDSLLVSNGKCEYVATKSGNYQVLVYDSACPAPMSAVYNFIYTGIENQGEETVFVLFPNPTNSNIYIQLKENDIHPYSVTLTNLSGRALFSGSFMEQTSIDISLLPAGLYLLKCYNKERVWNGKVVKY